MTPTDNEFYEAYKKSASFCDDLYQKEREKNYKSGIKYYIEDMEHTPFSVARMIPREYPKVCVNLQTDVR